VALPHPVLRSLLKRKGRREHGLFLLEGFSLLEEALRSGLGLEEVRVSPRAAEAAAALLARARDRGAAVIEVSERSLARLSDLETPPGILCVARQGTRPLHDVLATGGPVVLLAGIADPGNAGSLIRSAEAFGATGIVFGTGGVDPYNPKVVRAAMGSLFRVPHALAEPAELLRAAAAQTRAIVAADRSGQPLPAFSFPERPIVAVGSERGGLAAWLPRWDAAVSIPHLGPTESLNAAVAGAIVLYEWAQRAGFRPQK
jgi:TrmH family RNA methyltransferase